jgi:glycolate oxidase FAD binding subunit
MSNIAARLTEIQNLVVRNKRLLPRGGGTKTALSAPAREEMSLDMRHISGMVEYDPAEFTFTAYAGTQLAEIERLLSQHDQYLPFDPPLVERGSTLGGTVASGLSGSGRYRFGGIRDFILGVRFIDGRGELVRGGGKVVKNVAGYDLPKLMVGSLGGLGVLVELSFKVFPRPKAFATVQRKFEKLGDALSVMKLAADSNLQLEAIDLDINLPGFTLWVRMGGIPELLLSRMDRLQEAIGSGLVLLGEDEQAIWRGKREFTWLPDGYSLVKVPLTPGCIVALELSLGSKQILRRYIAGGQLAWLALDDPPRTLDSILSGQDLSGLVLIGPPGLPNIGKSHKNSFQSKVKDVLDPGHRFLEV